MPNASTNTNKKNGPKKPKTPKAPKPKKTLPVVALDRDALRYARLLADPCNSPLAHPTYGGGNGGYLIRAESIYSIAVAAGQTSGYIHWTPGAIGSTGSQMLVGATNGSGVLAASAAAATTVTPGYAFLVANAAGYRCAAACMKVTFVGAESARAGRIHIGNSLGAQVDLGASYSTDTLAPVLPLFSRTPPLPVEINFRPTDADEQWMDPNAITAAVDKDRRASITLAFADLPAAVGLYVHFTAVYEWMPRDSIGLANASASTAQTNNTTHEVINFLDRTGKWFAKGFEFAGEVAQVARQMAGMYGMMPSSATYRNNAALLG